MENEEIFHPYPKGGRQTCSAVAHLPESRLTVPTINKKERNAEITRFILFSF